MRQEHFNSFRQRAEKLMVRYAASLHDPEIRESLDFQVHQLLHEYAPGTLFEKRLNVQESELVLASALSFYKTIFAGTNGG